MQKKKEDLKQDIYQAACYEFLHKGYANASMRAIAKRANTSIGNIYHYYENKGAILDEMMEYACLLVERLMKNHLEQKMAVSSFEEFSNALSDDLLFYESGFVDVLQSEVVIFLKQEEPRWQEIKQRYLFALRKHVAWHMRQEDPNDTLIVIITNMFLDSFVFIMKTNTQKDQAIKDFRRLFRMICTGIVHPKL